MPNFNRAVELQLLFLKVMYVLIIRPGWFFNLLKDLIKLPGEITAKHIVSLNIINTAIFCFTISTIVGVK